MGDAGGVDADLVGAGIQQCTDIVHVRDTTADGERNEDLVRDGLDHVVQQAARLDAGADVEEGELVRTLVVVAPRDFDGIAGILQVDEVDALDDATRRNIETGNDALGECHDVILPAQAHAGGV